MRNNDVVSINVSHEVIAVFPIANGGGLIVNRRLHLYCKHQTLMYPSDRLVRFLRDRPWVESFGGYEVANAMREFALSYSE